MTEFQNDTDQATRRKIVAEELQTYHSRALNEIGAGGRFAAAGLSKQSIVGASGGPTYPRLPASSAWSGGVDAKPADRVDITYLEDPRTASGLAPASEPAAPSQVPSSPAEELLSDANLPASTSSILPSGVDAGLSHGDRSSRTDAASSSVPTASPVSASAVAGGASLKKLVRRA